MIATVSSVSGYELSVIPDGSVTAITAIDCCGAQAGDRVVLGQHATQMLAIAIVGGPHVPPAVAYVLEAGVAWNWQYILWSDGKLMAWRTLAAWTTTAGIQVVDTVTLPKVMADTDYVVQVTNGNWRIAEVWEIVADRTVNACKIGMDVADAANESTTLNLTLYGTVNI